MAELLSLEIVTPEKIAVSEEVEMAVVPGAMGDMGIMARHAPIIAALRPGVVEIHRDGAVAERFFVAGGYVEMHGNLCTVLAEELIPVSALDKARIEADIEDMERRMGVLEDEGARIALQTRLAQAEARKLAAA